MLIDLNSAFANAHVADRKTATKKTIDVTIDFECWHYRRDFRGAPAELHFEFPVSGWALKKHR
jgi:hypothetical protein